MPAVACPHCSNTVVLPDPWTAPGYTCPHCTAAVSLAALVPLPPAQPTKRPLNACAECGHTWFPRGSDASRQCPACGAPPGGYAPAPAPRRAPAAAAPSAFATMFGGSMGCLAAVAVAGLVLFGALFLSCAGVLNIGFGVARRDREPVEPKAAPDPAPRPKAGPTPTPKPAPPAPSPGGAPGTPAPPATPSTPAGPKPVDPIADPRRSANAPPVALDRPWVKRGAVETRVAGAWVARPVLTDRDGNEYRAPAPVLLLRVEARKVPGGGATVELRRWVGGLSSAATVRGPAGALAPVRYPGATVSGQIEGGVKLQPGGPAVADVLAFEVPPSGDLLLVLAGSHAAQDGTFDHFIRAEEIAGLGARP